MSLVSFGVNETEEREGVDEGRGKEMEDGGIWRERARERDRGYFTHPSLRVKAM